MANGKHTNLVFASCLRCRELVGIMDDGTQQAWDWFTIERGDTQFTRHKCGERFDPR
jgi:hypothetical protein